MHALLKKVLSLAVPAMVAGAAFLHAQAIGSLVDATTTPKSIAPFAEARAAEREERSPAAKSGDVILKRNVFDHTDHPKLAPTTFATPDIIVANAPPCEGVRALITVAAATPDSSFAAIDVGGKHHLARRGTSIDGFDVVYVGADRVWLRQGETICQAKTFADAPPAKPGTPPGSALEQQIGKQIEKTGPTSYAIDRGAVSRILEAQAELIKVPVAPEQENGKVVGYRLVRIKPGSVLATLGLASGDRLESINGISVLSPEGMLEAYSRLGALDRMAIQLTRGGRPLTLDYTVK